MHRSRLGMGPVATVAAPGGCGATGDGQRPVPASSRRVAALGIAPSLAAAGGIHLALAAQHGPSGKHGILFFLAGLSQVALAVTISRALVRWALIAAIGLSVGIIGSWMALTLPDVITGGETPGALEQVSIAAELAAVAFAMVLMRPGPIERRRHGLALMWLCGAAILGGTATVLGGTSHGGHHHDRASADGHLPQIASPMSDANPIFGDLFAGHHSDRHDCGHDHPAGNYEPGASPHCGQG